MRNEWRANLWMILELTIIGGVLWVIFTIFAGLAYIHRAPEGVDFSDVYVGEIHTVGEESTTYRAYPDSLHNYLTDLEMLVTRLKANPDVEMIGRGDNAIPYQFNFYGCQLETVIGDTVQSYNANLRTMDPDMIRVLRLRGVNGETPEELAAIVEAGKCLMSTVEHNPTGAEPEKWVGKEVVDTYSPEFRCQVGALISPLRRMDYEPTYGGVVVAAPAPAPTSAELANGASISLPGEIAVRVKPGKGAEFMASLLADDVEFGNVYVSNLRSVDDRRREAHFSVETTVRNLSACALFSMVVVFLGFLGTFWYRTQQRAPEIALRKVNGATNADIFRRMVGEGLILLLVASPFVVGMSALAYKFMEMGVLDSTPIPESLYWLMIPVSLASLALMIVVGTGIPASKAMRINPAETLKDE